MSSRIIYALPALILALLAIGLAVFGLLKHEPAQSGASIPDMSHGEGMPGAEEEASPKFHYLLARQKLDPGSLLDPEQFVEVVSDTEIEGVIPAGEAPFGEELQMTLAQGLPLSEQVVSNESPIRMVLEDGVRAMAFQMDSLASVGGLLRAGDVIDIVASFKGDSGKQAASMILLPGVEVLAVRGATEADAEPDEEQSRRNATMVLAVPEAEVSRLTLAVAEANLSFVASKRMGNELVAGSGAGNVPGKGVSEPLDTEDAVADGTLGDPESPAVFLSQIRPIDPEAPATTQPAKGKAAPEEDPGMKVLIFEGATSRNVYVR
ncbi:Flp pilus assembly protein CpaB [Marinobacter sp. ANT_B65]|uniref:Flp pilus assembly protein CpaB n=1 Tax=Marinobacter sp. ANT_B65 TaxID=2039467 RepID=UPI000BBE6F2D|nr:Flp pilus assembly protein CpaB [Marinobacter sp. ANT_B65]PCM44259.1 Flp pilus assembly protein CpaB [Marinobacter sp. ANT_B65]